MNFFVGNAYVQDIVFFAIVPPLMYTMGMTIVVPIVSAMGVVSFKRRIDTAIVLYPAMSTIDDIVVTLCYVVVVRLVLAPSVRSPNRPLLMVLTSVSQKGALE